MLAGHAQTPPPPVPQVNLTFKAVTLGRGITGMSYIVQGKKTPFYPPALNLSPPLHYSGPYKLEFSQTQTINDQPAEVPVAQLAFPLDTPEVMVLFAPSRTQPGKYIAVAVPNAEADSPRNSARVINYSGRPLPIALNEDRSIMQPNEVKIVKLPKGTLEVFIPRIIKLSADQAEVSSQSYRIPKGGRMTLLVVPSGMNKSAEDESVSLYELNEPPAPPKPKSQAGQ